MPKQTLVIADSDDAYVEKMSRYLLEKMNRFHVITFSQMSPFYTYLTSNHAELFLIGESVMSEDLAAKLEGSVVGVLSTHELDKPCFGFKRIHKFQKTSNIINELRLIYAEKHGDTSILDDGGQETKLAAVYSVVGGSGKTTMALGLSALAAARFDKVLYLNFEKTNSTERYFTPPAGSVSFSEVLLSAKEKSGNAGLCAQRIRLRDASGVYYFAPAESATDFNDLNGEEYTKLLREIVSVGGFDYVFVDLPSEFSDFTLRVLNQADRIIMPLVAGVTALAKQAAFLREKDLDPDIGAAYDKAILVANRTDGAAAELFSLLGGRLPAAEVPRLEQLPRARNVAEVLHCTGGYLDRCLQALL